jgi:uncharacterized SAM-binding protein YcdF (DUF218 family)
VPSLQHIADWLLIPPSGPLLLAILGLLLVRLLLGRLLLAAGLLLLYLFTLPAVSHGLMDILQREYWPPAETMALDGAGAIVVLGAGYRSGADEFAGETVSDLALVRLRYAAELHRQTGLPVLATGGGAEERVPEAHWMAEVLREYGVGPILQEDQALDTWGNARFSAALLAELGVQRIALVTHAYHMPRAVWSFEQAGLQVIPAPTGAFVPADRTFTFGSLRPQARALYASWLATHEFLGLAWYRLQHSSPHPSPTLPRAATAGSDQDQVLFS